jgi:hypothetical protein
MCKKYYETEEEARAQQKGCRSWRILREITMILYLTRMALIVTDMYSKGNVTLTLQHYRHS